MAQTALIEAVQQHTAATVAALWTDARAAAARCRDDAGRLIEEQRTHHAMRLRTVTVAAAEAANADAVRRSRRIRSEAKAAVADRALATAVAMLADLRDAKYADRFLTLAHELPPREWARVVVNPADASLARARFPGSDIRSDAGITGGVIAEDDALRVNNTFERRLAAAWPELLPAVMSDVLALLQRSQPVA
jgi:vacuolar-type H+-ATPase subunit E/Vma4